MSEKLENVEEVKLTAKQELFCAEYLLDFNATQAAIRAGYSENTAAQQGYENLRKPEIQKRLNQAKQERIERIEVTSDMILQECAKIGFANIGDIVGQDIHGDPEIDISAATPEMFAAIESIETARLHRHDDDKGELHRVKVKMHSKLGALKLAGNHVDIQCFKERKEVSVTNLSDALSKALERAKQAND